MSGLRYSTFDPAALGPLLALESANTIVLPTATTDINRTARALYGKQAFSWYAEFAAWGDDDISDAVSFGLVTEDASLSTYVGGDADGYGYRVAEGQIHNAGASVQAVTAGGPGDIVGVWLNIIDTTATVTWFLNGIALHTVTLPSTGPWYLAASVSAPRSDIIKAWLNTGQRAFEFPVAGAEGWFEYPPEVPTIRVSTRDLILPPDDPIPNAVYEGRLRDDNIEIVQSLAFWPDGRSQTQGSAVNITIANGDGALDGLLDFDLRDLPVTLEWIEQGQSILSADHVADMIVDDLQVLDDGALRLRLSSAMSVLDAPLQNMIFPPSADPVVAGKPWPILEGAARSVTPVLVDPVNRIYALSDRAIVGWGYIRDMGAPLDPNDIPPGYVISDDFRGVVLETEPVGKLTADASSTGGGTLPSLADDIWLGYGRPFAEDSNGDLIGFDDVVDAAYLAIGRLLFTSSSLAGVGRVALTSAQMDEGRHYRYRVVVQYIAPPHSFGQPYVALTTAGGIPLVSWTTSGTYEGVITASANIVPRLVFGTALHGTQAIIREAYILEIPDTYTPSNINAITLTDFVRSIVEDRAGLPASAWSRDDTEAIDAATGYAGIGFYASEPTTVRAALESVLNSYCACAWVDSDGVLRFTRLTPPEDEVAVGEITAADMLTEPQVRPDLAPALSTQMRYRKNWTVLGEGDFVSDFVTVPLAVRSALSQPFQGIAASAQPLSGTYSQAVNAEPAEVLLDVGEDAQAEVDHVAGYYGTLRKVYTFEVSAELPVKLGEVWTLTYPRYGLDAGKNLLVSGLSRRLGSETILLTLRG